MTYVENIDDTWFEPFGKKKYYNNTIRKILKLVKKNQLPVQSDIQMVEVE